jgi:hypothetical protein
MSILIGIIIIAFIIGLLSRKKGYGFLDTLSSGCGVIILIAFLIIVLLIIVVTK